MNYATLHAKSPGSLLSILVPNVKIKGFRFRSETGPLNFITLATHCAGSIVEKNEFIGDPNQQTQDTIVTGVSIESATNGPTENPVIVRDNRFEAVYRGVRLVGVNADYKTAEPSRGLMVVGNYLQNCPKSIIAEGELRDVLIAGNRIAEASLFGIQLEQLLGDAQNIVVTNNTFVKSKWPFRVWDENVRGDDVSVVNNLSLKSDRPDWVFFDSGGKRNTLQGPGNVVDLAKSWRFGANIRESSAPAGHPLAKAWIPPSEKDALIPKLDERWFKLDEHGFPRPSENSKLATGGFQDDSLPLPKYVGALAPDNVAEWDWEMTWRVLVTKQ